MRWLLNELVLEENKGHIELAGQFASGYSSAMINFDTEGRYELQIELKEGSLRISHGSYTPDGGTWLSGPSNGQQPYYDLNQKRIYTIHLQIGSSFGYVDRISIVNPKLRKNASFSYALQMSS